MLMKGDFWTPELGTSCILMVVSHFQDECHKLRAVAVAWLASQESPVCFTLRLCKHYLSPQRASWGEEENGRCHLESVVCHEHKKTLESPRKVWRIFNLLDLYTELIEAGPEKKSILCLSLWLYFVGPVSLGNFVYTIFIINLITFKVTYSWFLCIPRSHQLPPNYQACLVHWLSWFSKGFDIVVHQFSSH